MLLAWVLTALLTVYEMDETLFRLPGLLDYRATVSKGRNGRFRLHIDMHSAEEDSPTDGEVLNASTRLRRYEKPLSKEIWRYPRCVSQQRGSGPDRS